MKEDMYFNIYLKAYNNAIRLIENANNMFNQKIYNIAYFLAFTALEEISKSQLAADVYTKYISENDFLEAYRKHEKKKENITWALEEVKLHRWKFIGPDVDDLKELITDNMKLNLRNASLYVDYDLSTKSISMPEEVISELDAEELIHLVEVTLDSIRHAEELSGKVGSKSFQK